MHRTRRRRDRQFQRARDQLVGSLGLHRDAAFGNRREQRGVIETLVLIDVAPAGRHRVGEKQEGDAIKACVRGAVHQ